MPVFSSLPIATKILTRIFLDQLQKNMATQAQFKEKHAFRPRYSRPVTIFATQQSSQTLETGGDGEQRHKEKSEGVRPLTCCGFRPPTAHLPSSGMPVHSPLRGKSFYGREWALQQLQDWLDGASGEREPPGASPPPCVLVTGAAGSGKTALCSEALWPTSEAGRRAGLGARALAWHFCRAQDAATLAVPGFVRSLADQIGRCRLLPSEHRRRLAEPQVEAALEPDVCDRDPDEAFKRAVLLPLLALPPPARPLLLLVDSVDEGADGEGLGGRGPPGRSGGIAELLSSHLRLLPPWLLLVCSARSEGALGQATFPEARRLSLDDPRQASTRRDCQSYILRRLEREAALEGGGPLSPGAAEALAQLQVKSGGCLLYLERVLDAVAAGGLRLGDARHVPATLNGLYLWLCQRLFPGRGFPRVRPLLDALLAAPRPLPPERLYAALWARHPGTGREDFEARLAALAPLLAEGPRGSVLLFHHSLAEWLQDVKHCTPAFLCRAGDGHAALALALGARGPRLAPAGVRRLARHLALARLPGLGPCHRALWLVWSGAPVDGCLAPPRGTPPWEPEALQLLVRAGARPAAAGGPAWGVAGGALRLLLEHDGACVNRRDEHGRTLLASAALSGDHEAAGLLLARGAAVEPPDGQGQTPLTLAARRGHARVLRCLLAHGARVDLPDSEGWTALRAAAWGGHAEAVGALLRAGAAVDRADAGERTALRAAAWGGHEPVVRALLRAGAAVDLPDAEGRTALTAAAYMGHRGTVELLLAHGARPDRPDADGRTALWVAALGGHAAVVRLLLAHGARPGLRDRDGLTPLLAAAYEGRAEVLGLLLAAGADPDEADAEGRTALLAAAAMGHSEAVAALLARGAGAGALDPEGRTALGLAAAGGAEEAVRTLLAHGLDENHRDDRGWTPLHLAAAGGHAAVCSALAERGARLGEVDNEGRPPLLLAAQDGHTDAARLLLDLGAAVEQRGYDGRSALCLAALGGHGRLARLLLARGADPDPRDADGRPVAQLLALAGRADTLALLLARGAGAEGRDPEGRTALHAACWLGQPGPARLLLRHGAAANALDAGGRPPLHSAAWAGHAELARLLLDAGAAVDQACAQGATALGLAAQQGHVEVARLLLAHGADPARADGRGRTPVRVAARSGHGDLVRLLLQGRGRPAAETPAAAGGGPALPPGAGEPSPGRPPPPSPARRSGDEGGGEERPLDPFGVLDPRLHRKQMLKLRFEGPTHGAGPLRETPM
ncbi:ankyrin repeat domain-containing protein 50-like [Ornithorhynchus anatinus]|uniref:ankyrin repeat domain-containing protein 50-like n=1 Tax=Ornithorhynchus anatinus TaxID=9258 RepID=UPI0019D4E0FC|nr:ankyrin repeat domain-containing protein 50-like [Ornithorhynchus anatinus]